MEAISVTLYELVQAGKAVSHVAVDEENGKFFIGFPGAKLKAIDSVDLDKYQKVGRFKLTDSGFIKGQEDLTDILMIYTSGVIDIAKVKEKLIQFGFTEEEIKKNVTFVQQQTVSVLRTASVQFQLAVIGSSRLSSEGSLFFELSDNVTIDGRAPKSFLPWIEKHFASSELEDFLDRFEIQKKSIVKILSQSGFGSSFAVI